MNESLQLLSRTITRDLSDCIYWEANCLGFTFHLRVNVHNYDKDLALANLKPKAPIPKIPRKAENEPPPQRTKPSDTEEEFEEEEAPGDHEGDSEKRRVLQKQKKKEKRKQKPSARESKAPRAVEEKNGVCRVSVFVPWGLLNIMIGVGNELGVEVGPNACTEFDSVRLFPFRMKRAPPKERKPKIGTIFSGGTS